MISERESENLAKGAEAIEHSNDVIAICEQNIESQVMNTEFIERVPTKENCHSDEPEECENKRIRTRTLKGLRMDLSLAQKKYNRVVSSVKTKVQDVDNSLKNSEDLVKLVAGKDSLEVEMNDMKLAHEAVMEILHQLEDDESEQTQIQAHTVVSKTSFECLADVKMRIDDLKIERMELISQRSRSEKSRSVKSASTRVHSLHSATSSAKQTAIEKATLKTKMESLKRKQALERQREELRRQESELMRAEEQEELLCEMKRAEEIERIIEEESNAATRPSNRKFEVKISHHEKPSSSPLPPIPTEPSLPFTSSIPTDFQRETTEIQKQQLEMIKRLTLPVPKPPVFDGNILDFPRWESAFDALIDEESVKPSHKLYYLGEYTDGIALKMISGLIGLRTNEAYERARKILKERFGDPFQIYDAYSRRLKAWPMCISSKDIQEFSDFLVMTKEMMSSVKYLKELDNFTIIQELAARLPNHYMNRWRENAKKTECEKGEYRFNDFVAFVEETSRDANHPVFSYEALNKTRRGLENKSTGSTRHVSEKRQNRGSTFKVAANEESGPQRSEKSDMKKIACYLCGGSHVLKNCKEFLEKTVQERVAFCKQNRICFVCLVRGHMSRQCKTKIECEVCKKRHSTMLHYESKNDEAEKREVTPTTENFVSVCHASGCGETTSSLILPVWLSHKKKPEHKIEIYAVIDDQSDTCFITDEVREELGLQGPEILLELGTMHAVETVETQKIEGLVVSHNKQEMEIPLPKCYSRQQIPVQRDQIPRPEIAKKWKHLRQIAEEIPSYKEDLPVGILIGNNCIQAIKPRNIIPGEPNDPYAIQTALGWGIIGAICGKASNTMGNVDHAGCHRIATTENGSSWFVREDQYKEVITPQRIGRMFEQDFSDTMADKLLSQDDIKFMDMTTKGIHKTDDGHYEMPLPFRNRSSELPCNKRLAETRLVQLKKRFERDPEYKEHYVTFMNEMFEKGHAEKAPEECKSAWYIPHHGVYHPKKPGKIRVVFDCSAKCDNQSLNQQLLQGPDLTNSLIGVLCRFRQEPVAFACDIEGMFHQVRVNEEDRDFLRFLWWKDGDTTKEPEEYRMTVHLFGATSSPGCANLALKTTADDHATEVGEEAAEFIKKNFYVDDGLKSVKNVESAISLIKKGIEICKKGGFRLCKFTANRKEVIESIEKEDRVKDIKNIDLDKESLPPERVLGVEWNIRNDSLKFHITLKDKPLTRRSILSTVSSIYDPLGLAAPFVVRGKKVLQMLCKEGVDWDEPIPDPLRAQWEEWRSELPLLENIEVPRCFKPDDFQDVKSVELHHFSDASIEAYGQCTYIRLVNTKDRVNCSLVMGKARVAPLKPITIPRLELTAALVSVRISKILQKELDYEDVDEVFWTDSKVVKAYIHNDSRRFHTYVANRVHQIREHTSPEQWKYVQTSDNPADDASRGLSPKNLSRESRWIKGPEFLWSPNCTWHKSNEEELITISEDDKEVKKASTMTTTLKKHATLLERLEYFSSWYRAKRAVAVCLRYIKKLKNRVNNRQRKSESQINQKQESVTVEELRRAEELIIKAVQEKAFEEEIRRLKKTSVKESSEQERRTKLKTAKKSSAIFRLDPFLDRQGVLHVGGRIRQASISDEVKHPVILPKSEHISMLIIRHFHEATEHQGRGFTLNEIRSSGYWIVGCSTLVSRLIHNCVTCQKLRAAVQEQKMSDLPSDRLEPAPPFTYCGADYFGPWHVKEGRKELKRYGVLFTCLASRAVHLEVANSLETDSYINALRRFICRRGPVRQIRSDQGTNFVGAKRELKEALTELNQDKVKGEMLKLNCDWIEFKLNVPSASHMGGIWERQIRTVRSVLSGLLQKNGSQLNDEALRTLMCEAEAIVNSRPLTIQNLTMPNSVEPLTPNHLLTLKSKVVLPPPGKFQSADGYCRKYWRRVQHLTNEFWCRWRKEFLNTLQQRKKWNRTRENLKEGDIVIVKEDNVPRNKWKLAQVIEAVPEDDKLVRKVKIRVGSTNGPVTVLARPVQKLVLLLKDRVERRPGIPDEEP